MRNTQIVRDIFDGAHDSQIMQLRAKVAALTGAGWVHADTLRAERPEGETR